MTRTTLICIYFEWWLEGCWRTHILNSSPARFSTFLPLAPIPGEGKLAACGNISEMLKIANGYSDFCVPYTEKRDVLVELLNEMVEGEEDSTIPFNSCHNFVYLQSASRMSQSNKFTSMNQWAVKEATRFPCQWTLTTCGRKPIESSICSTALRSSTRIRQFLMFWGDRRT